MAAKHIVAWPKARITIDGKKSKILERGDVVPKGVSAVDLANLVSFGAIVGANVPDEEDLEATPTEPTTIPEIEKAVGTDKALAQEYLDAEKAADKPRGSLIEKLQAVLDAEPTPPAGA